MKLLKLSSILIALYPTMVSAKISSIEFKGVSAKKQIELRTEIPALFTRAATQSDIDHGLQFLYRSGLYETLQVFETGDDSERIVFVATAVKKIKSVVIKGNARISEHEIRDILNIDEDDRFNKSDIVARGERVRDLYNDKGFLNTGLEIDFKEIKDGEIQVIYTIREGSVCEIDSIKFSTSNEELKAGLSRELKSFVRVPLNDETLSKLQTTFNNYFVENRYLNSQLSGPDIKYSEDRAHANLVYTIERPFRFVIFTEGNQVFSSSEIIRSLELEKPNTLGSAPSTEILTRIEKLYQKNGYANVTVNMDERVLTQNFVRQLRFKIDEGPKVKIKSIEILGANAKSQKEYVDFIKEHSSPLISKMIYNKDDLDLGLKNLGVELQNQGFLKARIVSTRVEFEKNKQFVHVVVQVEEGPLTRIHEINYNGIKAFKKEDLSNVLLLKPNDPLKLNQLESGIDRLKDFYHSQGYLDMAISNERESTIVEYSNDNTAADLNFDISEGPKVTVGSIAVDGNSMTKEYVILKELEFDIGDVLTPQKIKDSEYRLQRLGLFGLIEIRTLEVGTSISERTVIVKVSERDPGILNFGLGANTEFQFTIRGYTGIGYRNLGGTARGVTGRLELKKISDIDFIDQRITFGYLEPYVLGTRTRGRVNLTRFNSIVNRYNGPYVQARSSTLLEFNLEREFDRHFKFIWNFWSIQFLDDYFLASPIPSTYQVIGTVGPTLEVDYRDNPFTTHSGTFTRLAVEYADPYLGSSQKIQYLRAISAFNYYVPTFFSPRVIFAQSLRGGYQNQLAQNGFIPDEKRFYLGGRSSIRGFDPAVIPPNSAPTTWDPSKNVNVLVKSDSYFYLSQTELRFPVYGDLEGVVFYDGGSVIVTGYQIQPEYRDAAGFGIRYNTPVGPVSAEYGFKLNRQGEEPEGRFHFSIGSF